jgi:hypothetical protein
MNNAFCILLLLTAASLLAQDKNPVTSAVKEILPRQQKNLAGAADEMPAAKYNYKPTEKQMPYGHLVLHVIQSNYMLCSKISDTPEPKPATPLKETDGKDTLVPALKASFDFCSTALGKVDDSKLADEVELFGGRKGSKAFALLALSGGWADHYSAAAIYLRLNGLLPPTAQPKK